MVLCRNTVCLVLATLLLLAQFATLSVHGETDTIRFQHQFDKKPVLEWSVNEVVEWMNNTIGYAEYSDYVRKHLIDGPTLLEMEPVDFESFFPITSPLHVIKIQAHIKLLRGQCSCHDATIITGMHSFWTYMKHHNVRTWVEGTTALYFSRITMLSAYLFDHQLYMDVISSGRRFEDEYSKIGNTAVNVQDGGAGLRSRKFVYWVSWIFAPDLYLAYHCARFSGVNYFLMPIMVIHFITQAVNEYFILYTIYKKAAFTPGTGILERIWCIYSYTIFAPIAGLVVGYAFPIILQYICVLALIIHNLGTLLALIALIYFRGSLEASQSKDNGKDVKETKTSTRTNTNAADDKNNMSSGKID
ncbi:unnamed protein product [Phytomonas sp. Hart1]|nr:unnamed protein product [Phytomonas sp. Hart1]|eukprot:CCW67961.1 unnamed protein product [Phytomonas sp. isolate Hart1]